MANISEVARLAGVSKTTVSRVINNYSLVTDRTRQRVLEAMRQLDYTPNPMARGLTLEKTFTVALVSTGVGLTEYRTNLFHLEVSDGARDAIDRLGYHTLLFAGTTGEAVRNIILTKIMREKRADGVILIGSYLSAREIQEINLRNIPFVLVNRNYRGKNIFCIRAKVSEGMQKMVEYLIQKGHRRIGFIGNLKEYQTFQERLQGYRRALEVAGIPYQPQLVPETNEMRFSEEMGFNMTQELLENKSKITAICSGNDYLAIGAMRAIKARGLRIAEDIAVTGFDDILLARYVEPSLTTVKMPLYEMGKAAAEELIRHLTGTSANKRAPIFETQLIIRASA